MNTEEIIEAGLSLIQNDPHHHLGVGFRCGLLASIDDIGDANRRARTNLATLAVEKVLPLWESLFKTDRTPHKAIELAQRLLAGAVSSAIAENERGDLWAHCDELAWRHAPNQYIVAVGYAAAQVVREALSDRPVGCDQVTDGSTDMDIDPYDHDSGFCASIAYSGGPPWGKHSDSQKRLAFWTWWLTSAVPTAINAG